MICFEISRSRSNLVTVLTLKFHVTNHALTINLDQSDEAAHWCLNTQTQEKVCAWCVFESYTHSISAQKIKSLILFWKVVPGGATILFQNII